MRSKSAIVGTLVGAQGNAYAAATLPEVHNAAASCVGALDPNWPSFRDASSVVRGNGRVANAAPPPAG